MRCVTYRRVSTDRQSEEGFSLAAQETRLTAFIESQGWKHADDYLDDGFSAKNIERPAMQRLLEDIKKDKFDIVLVYRLDRLVRSVVDLHNLLKIFEDHRVNFRSATESFDTTTASGRMFITFIATLAEWERNNLAERVRFGSSKKAESGQRVTPMRVFGYDLVDKELVINPKEAKWVRYAFENYKTVGYHTIAKKMNAAGMTTTKGNPWRAEKISYMLENIVYCGYNRYNYRDASGKRTYNEIVSEGTHEPIIDKSLFDEVQLVRDRRSQIQTRDTTFPFSGIIRCARCGSRMNGTKDSRNHEKHYYRCSNYSLNIKCNMPIVSAESVNEAFIQMISDFKITDDPEMKGPSFDEKDLKRQLKRLEGRIARLKELYLDGDITKSEYKKRLETETLEKEKILGVLDSYDVGVTPQQMQEFLNDIENNWCKYTPQKQKEAIQTLFKRIVVEALPKVGNKRRKVDIIDVDTF